MMLDSGEIIDTGSDYEDQDALCEPGDFGKPGNHFQYQDPEEDRGLGGLAVRRCTRPSESLRRGGGFQKALCRSRQLASSPLWLLITGELAGCPPVHQAFRKPPGQPLHSGAASSASCWPNQLPGHPESRPLSLLLAQSPISSASPTYAVVETSSAPPECHHRLVREIAQDFNPDLHFQSTAHGALQDKSTSRTLSFFIRKSSKDSHETCNQGSSGQQQLVQS
ncbi:hypothetical protein QTO34_018444 [Cnephaeus nilssonii]|uniref:Uncharacterized protein n=1 Tax=Cnephaeus nilssonii TaxID=3371016 RepID=A0AA40LQD0_CNENI|nr:hypothetical protein QTO34_018444 [Eptesicus nilssonii]